MEIAAVEPVDDADQPQPCTGRTQPAHVHDAAGLGAGEFVQRAAAGLDLLAQLRRGRRRSCRRSPCRPALPGRGVRGRAFRLRRTGRRNHSRHPPARRARSAARRTAPAFQRRAPAKSPTHSQRQQRRSQPVHRASTLHLGPQDRGSPGASASGRSSAISPGPKWLAASACIHTAAQAASNGGMRCAISPAQMPGQDVAGAGGCQQRRAVAVDRRPAVGRGNHRVRPFVDHRRRWPSQPPAALCRASTIRHRDARSGNSRRNSPSCGVSTSVGAPADLAVQRIRRGSSASTVNPSASNTIAPTNPAAAAIRSSAKRADLRMRAKPRPEHQCAGLSRAP